MKFSLLSGIHSNHYALHAVLKAVRKNNIDTLLIAGDFIGYYFWPAEVFQLLEPWDVVAIRGNHDKMLGKAEKDKQYLQRMTKKYGSGLKVALEQLDHEKINWLATLPDSKEYKLVNESILICHGSPWNVDEYVYPDAESEILDRYASLDVNYVLQGHTHHPMIKKVRDITVINAGSVGQPRNRQPGAQWAMLDTEQRKVVHYCEPYDSSKIILEAKKRDPGIPYLADVMVRT